MEVTSILRLGFGKGGQAHGSNFRASIRGSEGKKFRRFEK
jgi:hypothetical protein